jgi:DNA-binding PadR family transcriptional regulator
MAGNSGYNERKLQVLELLEDGSWWSGPLLSSHTDLSPAAATVMLRHYWRDGLLVSQWQYPYRYFSISESGRQRLALLREWAEADAVEPAEDGDADVNLDEETCEDNDHETDDEAPSDAPDSDVEPDDDNDQFPRVGAR